MDLSSKDLNKTILQKPCLPLVSNTLRVLPLIPDTKVFGSLLNHANDDVVSPRPTTKTCAISSFLSHNNPCFQCNTAITNFLVSHACKIRFHDIIDCTVHMFKS